MELATLFFRVARPTLVEGRAKGYFFGGDKNVDRLKWSKYLILNGGLDIIII